jgi:hypothetical protein
MTISHASPPLLPGTPASDTAASGDGGPGDGGRARHARTPVTEVPEPVYAQLEDWLIDYFLPMFRRTLGGEYRWCGQWWRHGEAISRLTALWHAWEVLRLQPGTGIATWYRDHLDHQLPILMGARGPFCQCSEDAHREPHEAAVVPAPERWWDLSHDPDTLVRLADLAIPDAAAGGDAEGGHDAA